MKRLYIKQKVFSLAERFTVSDANGSPRYYVEGSFLRIPKTFRIVDADYGAEVAVIEKKVLSLLPHFDVLVNGAPVASIDKEFSFFKPKYRLDAQGLTVEGDWWDMNFEVRRGGQVVAQVAQRWLSWGDSYEVTVLDDALEALVVAIVVAIDKVKADENDASDVATAAL